MSAGAELHVVRVFCAEDGSGGNALGVFLDGSQVPEGSRQAVATELGFAETVFIDDLERAELRIFTPGTELPFAGHPVVGVAWLLREQGAEPERLRTQAGEAEVRFEGELPFVAADPEWGPAFEFIEAGSATEVDELAGPPEDKGIVCVWSWMADSEVAIRARVFFDDAGIAEDEATGTAAMRMVTQVGRPIQIRQGPTAGSLIYARPLQDGRAEIGGVVRLDEAREHALS